MRLKSTIAVAMGFTSTVLAQEHFRIGNAEVVSPAGWSVVNRDAERLVLRSADGRQQATVSIMRFGAAPSFDDFKRICQHRIDAEKKEWVEGLVQPDAPFEGRGGFGMFFSGGDKKAARIFSGYLSLVRRELVTIYVEGVGVSAKDHLRSFELLVKGLKRE